MTDPHNAKVNAQILRGLFDQASPQQRAHAMAALRPQAGPPARKPAAARPAPASTRAERAAVLDTRPDLSAQQRAALDNPKMTAKVIKNVLTCIPRGRVSNVSFGGRKMAPNAELDRLMGIKTGDESPIKRTAAGIQLGTMTPEQAREVLARHTGGGK